MTSYQPTTALIALLMAFFLSQTTLAAPSSPVGYWKTIDDETGEEKALVQIWLTNEGKLRGRIEKLLNPDPDDPNPRCVECEGRLKNAPIKGLIFLWGLEKDGNEWTGGRILDPENGEIYKAKVELKEGGQKLDVRGYVGFSMLGRTQTWHRVDNPPELTR